MKKRIISFCVLVWVSYSSYSQDLLGLSTGNYTGIMGMTTNPASIVDSRLKFDLNLIGVSNYYTNNYLSVKRDALIDGSFFKDKYKDWSAVQRDLLEETRLATGERVHMRLKNRVTAPLSFMATTGKKSAIALSIINRTGFAANNINQDFARLAYSEFNDGAYYGRSMDMSGANIDVLNWLDVGFTYGRVLVDGDKHFLKAAFTAKYIAGVASGYFEADDMRITFNDKNNIDAAANARYGHGEKLSFDMFKGASLRSLRPEAEGFGWNAGLVYEYRGRIDRFKYLTPENEERSRRDVNKYTFRLGVSVMDAGKLRFQKSELNNDFAANITDWNLKQYRIKSVSDIDAMLASRVNYTASGNNAYTVALPAAYSAQFDLHLVKGFYLNALTYQPLQVSSADRQVHVEPAYAVTPRFESRVFGLYVPVSYNTFDHWNIGASLRLGPVYVGSANLASLAFNKKTRTADVHAGVRIPITYGSPSRLANTFNDVVHTKNVLHLKPEESNDTLFAKMQQEIREMRIQIARLDRQRIIDSVSLYYQKQERQAPVSIIINNYGGGSSEVKVDSLVKKANAANVDNNITRLRTDSIAQLSEAQKDAYLRNLNEREAIQNRQVDTLLRRLAEKELQLRLLQDQHKMPDADTPSVETEKPVTGSQKNVRSFFRSQRRISDSQEKSNTNQQGVAFERPLASMARQHEAQYNKLQDEIRDLRKQINRNDIAQSALLVGAGAAGNNNKKLEKEIERLRTELNIHNNNITAVPAAIAMPAGAIRDTVYIRDSFYTTPTVRVDTLTVSEVAEKTVNVDDTPDRLVQLQLEKILFKVNQAHINPAYMPTLDFIAGNLNKYQHLGLQIDAYTDKSGSAVINERLSMQRGNAVKTYLLGKNVTPAQLTMNHHGANSPVADNKTQVGQVLNRRVELKFFKR